MELVLYSTMGKKEYAKYLIKRFGSTVSAANVIDEMLKVCPEGSNKVDLKEIRKILFQDR